MNQVNSSSRIFVSTTFAPDNSSLVEVIRACHEKGLGQLEFGSNHCYEPDPIGAIKQFQGQYLVHNYFPPPKEGFVVNIASSNNEIFQRSINHIVAAIDFCSEIGVKLYTFHPGFLTDPRESTQDSNYYDFCFDDRQLISENRINALERMLQGIEKIVSHAKKRKVKIAIETEGSMAHKEHLLMQDPNEYERLFRYFSSTDVSVNLNLGHLRLASNAVGFKIADFVDLISEYMVAMEVSHNDGVHDEHKLLGRDEWYWEVICDPRFAGAYKILEVRNVSLNDVINNLLLFEKCYAETRSEFAEKKMKRVLR
jgi:sugar phosphate isomerase/epimerase